jgi:hypothetical protein
MAHVALSVRGAPTATFAVVKPWERLMLGGGGVLVLLVGIGLMLAAIDERRDDEALDDRGIEVVAEVVRFSVDDDGESTTSDVVVRFNHPGDDPTVTETEIMYSDDFEADFPDAETEGVRIVFDRDHPERARIASESRDRAVELFVGAGVCVVIGLALGVGAVVAFRAAARK